jgi:hypothetical protein
VVSVVTLSVVERPESEAATRSGTGGCAGGVTSVEYPVNVMFGEVGPLFLMKALTVKAVPADDVMSAPV